MLTIKSKIPLYTITLTLVWFNKYSTEINSLKLQSSADSNAEIWAIRRLATFEIS